jgi:hypothetical protein
MEMVGALLLSLVLLAMLGFVIDRRRHAAVVVRKRPQKRIVHPL